MVAGTVAAGCGSDGTTQTSPTGNSNFLPKGRPNILLLLVDEMRLPPEGYGPNEGEVPGLKEILSFAQTLSPNNPYTRFFPGLMRLRQNSMVLRKHYIAAAACSPSRTTFLTGQYPSLHGVTQVTGTFSAADEVKYLDPTTVPTVGDWFRAAGYSSHYMGKWHVSDTSAETGVDSLEPWGFSDYRPTAPEPNSTTDNLATYRDPGFAETISQFLRSRGNGSKSPDGDNRPWFAVASFVNPHDTGAYPCPFFGPDALGDVTGSDGVSSVFLTGGLTGKQAAQEFPKQGDLSYPNTSGVIVDLNPDGFPQDIYNLPPTHNEDLSTKPQCHFEMAYKMQMALAAPFPLDFQNNVLPYPLQLLPPGLARDWAKTSGAFYLYLQYLVDIELTKILNTFDEVGLTENTIIVFTSDHGTLGMAHNLMLQKFFNAYEEAMRVPMVVSSPLVNSGSDVLEYKQPTSHVDLVPTLLGLAGFSDQDIKRIQARIPGHSQVRDLVGLNLVPRIASGATLERPGVLFTTSDDPTSLPKGVADPFYAANYATYQDRVNQVISVDKVPLVPGACREPNSVHMICTGPWKFARYIDDNGVEADQYEFYHLPSDPIEAVNLVDFKTAQLRPGVSVPGFTTPQLNNELALIQTQLAQQEAALLLTPI